MYMGCCEKNINHMYTYLYLGGGADLTIYYFIRGRFDQVILFWGPICRGPIWQRADSSSSPSVGERFHLPGLEGEGIISNNEVLHLRPLVHQ